VSLFTRIFILLVSVGIAPLIPTGALLFYFQSHAKDNALNVHKSVSEITATSVKQYINGVTRRLAFSEAVEDNISSKTKIDNVLKSALIANPDFLLIAVLNKNGREIYKEGSRDILNAFGYLNRSKDVVFLQSKLTNRVVFSNFNEDFGVPVGTLVFPLEKDKYLFLIVSFEQLWERIKEQKIGYSGRIYLASANGKIFEFGSQIPPIIAPEDLKNIFQKKIFKFEKIKAKEGIFVGAFKQVPDINLYVLTLQLRNEAFWIIKLTTSLIILFLLAITTASYFTALVLAKKIGDPIEELIDGADRVSKSDFNLEVDEKKAWGEFLGLFRSFNQMMKDLKHYDSIHVDKLLEEKKKVDLLIKLMRDGVVLADENWTPLFLNDTAQKILEDKVATSSRNGDKNNGEKQRSVLKKLVSDFSDSSSIKHACRIEGKQCHYKVIHEFFESTTGEPIRLIVFRDITLEREIDSMKEDFFNSIAHDLRAPILSIQGYIKLLEHSKLSKKEKEYLLGMRDSSVNIFKLVEDILDVAKMESGVVKPKFAKISFDKFAKEIEETFKPLLEEKNIQFKVIIQTDDKPVFFGDRKLLERAVNNLVSNSLKFTPKKGVITLEYADLDNHYEISVTDTGCGISQDKLKDIFEKYSQAGTVQGRKGYGLGLAIVKQIAHLHGGHTQAVSSDGKGTNISFTIAKHIVG
jgi:signal transduction histidine kinase